MTFLEVQTQVKNYLNRTDLDSQIIIWINQAMREAERGVVVLDGQEAVINWNHMKKRQTTDSDEVYITVVSNLKSMRWLKIYHDGQYYDLDKYDAETALSLYPHSGTEEDRPAIYAVMEEQGEIMVRPDPDQSYSYDIGFYQYTTALSANGDTNWWTLNAENVLVYGALLQSAAYIGHDERIPLWEKEYEKQIKKAALAQREFDASDRLLVIDSGLPRQLQAHSRFDFMTGE